MNTIEKLQGQRPILNPNLYWEISPDLESGVAPHVICICSWSSVFQCAFGHRLTEVSLHMCQFLTVGLLEPLDELFGGREKLGFVNRVRANSIGKTAPIGILSWAQFSGHNNTQSSDLRQSIGSLSAGDDQTWWGPYTRVIWLQIRLHGFCFLHIINCYLKEMYSLYWIQHRRNMYSRFNRPGG